jgi:hypothetical protein
MSELDYSSLGEDGAGISVGQMLNKSIVPRCYFILHYAACQRPTLASDATRRGFNRVTSEDTIAQGAGARFRRWVLSPDIEVIATRSVSIAEHLNDLGALWGVNFEE